MLFQFTDHFPTLPLNLNSLVFNVHHWILLFAWLLHASYSAYVPCPPLPALDLDSVSAPGLMPLPSPWICLPEPACISSLPGVSVFAQSPVKWPVTAHPAPTSASAYQPVSLDQSAIQHQSAGRPRTDILGHFRISHLPVRSHSLVPFLTRNPRSGSWILIGGYRCACFQDQNKSFNFLPCVRLKFWVLSPGCNRFLK
ncbi:hypothetical protein ILYODFUR_014206 [Ilyodon furcidens]|uniref:Uncharacterized protein n=1 Tax=Ilyodon furcidens TaxID=33524 RepID=A0ABV0UGY2_9TELE